MKTEQITIRQATQSDLPALEWDGEFLHFRRLYDEIFQSMCSGRAVMWVIELPDQGIVGQLFVQLSSSRTELADGHNRAYIYGFRIKPTYRRQGFGSQMMAVAEEDLRQRNFYWVTLNVARDNPQARRLYESLGYRVVASDPGKWSYFDHQGNRRNVLEPAWRMEKMIQNEAACVNA
jgi:ribosomal protein S18 acetylase RimI-like enzyme